MSTLNLPFIESKIQERDMPEIRGEFIGSFGLAYILSATLEDYSFYTVPDALDSLLVSVNALRAELSFPLDPFTMEYLRIFGLMPMQLTPNLWVYILGFVRFSRQVLGKVPSVSLFCSMFTLAPANRGNFNRTYMLSDVDKGSKRKFKD